MTGIRTRFPASAAALLIASAALMSGCAAEPGGAAPTSGADAVDPSSPAAEAAAAWLDGGRLLGVVTWGSSSCVPVVSEADAAGQSVTVTLADDLNPADTSGSACTDDLVARASIAEVPPAVDPSRDVDLLVSHDGIDTRVTLDGMSAEPASGEPTDYAPSAGWFDDNGVVLLTWGSSGCPPVVSDVEETDLGATVTFADPEGICTMDMAPRATIVEFSAAKDHEGFELTLQGGGLSGSILPL